MKTIRSLALLTLSLLCIVSLFSCSKNKEPEGLETGYLLIEGKQEVPDWVLSVNGTKISFAEYRHFYLNAKTDLLTEDAEFFSVEPHAEGTLRENTLNYLLECHAVLALAEEYDISLTREELKEIEAEVTAIRQQYGEEMYARMLSDLYLTEALYQSSMEQNALYEKVYQTMVDEGGALHVTEEELISHITENYVCFQQIYVDFRDGEGTNKHEKTDAYLAKVTERLDAGEAFEKVAFDLSNDATVKDYPNGYLLPKVGLTEQMVKTLELLNDGEVSEPLLEGTGYYILRKMPLSDEVLDENRDHILKGYTDHNGVHTAGLYEDRFGKIISEKAKTLSVEYADCYQYISTDTLY